jgi:protein phosphatase
MGSRAVVVVCRDEDAARERFGVTSGETGIVYTRTGRRFFNDTELETQFLDRLRTAMTASGFWDEFQTSWACLDCELMPWSAKAQELLRSQYAAVGAAGTASLPEAIDVLQRAAGRMNGESLSKMNAVLERFIGRQQGVEKFITAYRQYCWSVESLNDLKLAPFHLLATEGKVHTDQNHVWHMEALAKVCQADTDLLLATAFRKIDVTDLDSIAAGVEWWTSLTEHGGEGMVVKPADWIVRGRKGLVQPAVKCRGREYLRIIYSPDYDSEENLSRLRSRSLGRKRSLALREFALGVEALERFVRREPLRRVHECVFGVLALESEPVDPRL